MGACRIGFPLVPWSIIVNTYIHTYIPMTHTLVGVELTLLKVKEHKIYDLNVMIVWRAWAKIKGVTTMSPNL